MGTLVQLLCRLIFLGTDSITPTFSARVRISLYQELKIVLMFSLVVDMFSITELTIL